MKYKILIFLILYNTSHAQIPQYLNFNDTCNQLKSWSNKYPNLVSVFSYGKSKDNLDLVLLRINQKDNKNKRVILITSSIHANEPLSTTMTMGYIGYFLYHQKDERIKNILESRDLYFIPIVCPDNYPNTRHQSGLDPNRNFDSKDPIPEIFNLKKLFLQIKPAAAISGHTYGREFLMPYGNSNKLCSDDAKYHAVLDKMVNMSQYKLIRACEMYGRPIYGSELDYYYSRHSFAIVCEYGTHQHRPSWSDIEYEFKRIFPAILYFIEKAPILND